MTVKERRAELAALDRVAEGIKHTTREEWLARLAAYDREEDDPPLISLRPGKGSVFVSKNGSTPHRQASLEPSGQSHS